MQRNLIIGLFALVVLLAIAVAFLLLRDQPRAAPISTDASEVNATEPLHSEMDCYDQLLRNSNSLAANQVGPALASCRGGAGNESMAQ
jgi:hypothetical protein